MDIQHGSEQPKYWSEVIDKDTHRRVVTVAAEITFILDNSGQVIKHPRLVIAGGSVATGGLITLDEVLSTVPEAHDILADNEVDVTIGHLSDTEPAEVPSSPAIVVEAAPYERTRQEEIAAVIPTQFV